MSLPDSVLEVPFDLDAVRAALDELSALAETVARTAQLEGRSAFTDAENARIDEIDTRAGELRTLETRLLKVERAMRHPGAQLAGFYAGPAGTSDPWGHLDGLGVRGSALSAIALAAIERSGADVADGVKERATELVEHFRSTADGDRVAQHFAATSDPNYRAAFWKLVADPERGHFSLEAAEHAAMSRVQRAASLTDASGGYAVPFLLDPSVVLTNDGTTNPFRQISRIVTGVSDKWNGVSSDGVTASWDGEAAEVSDDAPTLAQPSITAHKAQAFIPFSIELGDDWRTLEAECVKLFADAKDRLEGAAFATGAGDGSNQPHGIITALVAASSPIVPSAGANTFAASDVYSVSEAVPARAWGNASWVAHRAIVNDARQFATANNYHAFLSDMTGDTPARLLGRPLYESSDMDGTYGSGENYALLCGDFSKFVVFDRIGMRVELVPHLFATQNNRPSGQRGFYAHWRVGSGCTDTGSFAVLNVT